MGQFTVDSLTRLLENVERSVLADALEAANLIDLVPSTQIETIQQLQQFFNLAQNFITFGPVIFGRQINRFMEQAAETAPALVVMWNMFRAVGEVLDDIDGRAQDIFGEIQKLKRLLQEDEDAELDKTDVIGFLSLATKEVFEIGVNVDKLELVFTPSGAGEAQALNQINSHQGQAANRLQSLRGAIARL